MSSENFRLYGIFEFTLSSFNHTTMPWYVLDYLTVNETAKEPPQDEEGKNSPSSLAIEATYINQNFSQQMLVVRNTHLINAHVWLYMCACYPLYMYTCTCHAYRKAWSSTASLSPTPSQERSKEKWPQWPTGEMQCTPISESYMFVAGL